MVVQFKICGLTRPEDARAADQAGASFGGVILAPGGRRTVTTEAAAEIFAGTRLERCGVFVDEDLRSVIDRARALDLAVVQLHGTEDPDYAASVRESGREVWKAIRPRDAAEFRREVERYLEHVDGILLDGWSVAGPGGTGTRFPWEAIAPERDLVRKGLRLIVAGGLGPDNVEDAIALLAPDIVDVSSGVESSHGRKDPELIRAFAAAVSRAALRGGVV